MTNQNPAINPAHYSDTVFPIEAIRITELCSFSLGNAIKYIWRLGKKDNILQEFDKACWYIDNALQRKEVFDKLDISNPDNLSEEVRELILTAMRTGRSAGTVGSLLPTLCDPLLLPISVYADLFSDVPHEPISKADALKGVQVEMLLLIEWLFNDDRSSVAFPPRLHSVEDYTQVKQACRGVLQRIVDGKIC